MRITNLAGVNLAQVQFAGQNFCSITGSVDIPGSLEYQVSSAGGPTVSGQVANLQYVDITPQGAGPFTVELNFIRADEGPATVTAKSADATVAVVYIGPGGASGTSQINGPYGWVTYPSSE